MVYGILGTVPVIVEINLYVQKRMKHRDILIEEILKLLARPISSHRPGKQNGRHEVAHRIGQRFLVAVYSRSSSNVVPVVTVYQE